jgi:hypothetical protein
MNGMVGLLAYLSDFRRLILSKMSHSGLGHHLSIQPGKFLVEIFAL